MGDGTGARVDGKRGRRTLLSLVLAPAGDGLTRRRGSDLVRICLAVLAVLLCWVVLLAGAHFEGAVIGFLTPPPDGVRWLVTVVWLLATFGLVVAVGGLALVTRRRAMIRDVGIAGLGAWGLSYGLEVAVGPNGGRPVPPSLAHVSLHFPEPRIAAAVAVALAAAPYLARGLRRTIPVVVVVGALAAIVHGSSLVTSAVASIALGWGVVAAVRLGFGAPLGLPSAADVSLLLDELGIHAPSLAPLPDQQWGEARYVCSDPAGAVAVSVYGRDARDAQLFAKVFRYLFYRDSGPTLTLTRLQQVEHEAYLTLLAASRGVRVPAVAEAGRAGPSGDALLVTRPPRGKTLRMLLAEAATRPDVTPEDGGAGGTATAAGPETGAGPATGTAAGTAAGVVTGDAGPAIEGDHPAGTGEGAPEPSPVAPPAPVPATAGAVAALRGRPAVTAAVGEQGDAAGGPGTLRRPDLPEIGTAGDVGTRSKNGNGNGNGGGHDDTQERAAPAPVVDVDDRALADAVRQVAALRAARIAHGAIGPDTVVVDGAEAGLVALGRASSDAKHEQLDRDVASLVAALALVAGPERVIAAASRGLPPGVLADSLSYLHRAALPPALGRQYRSDKARLTTLRERGAEAAGVTVPKLTEPRRVSWVNLLLILGTLIGGWALIGVFLDVGHSLSHIPAPNWGWVVMVFLLAGASYPSLALEVVGAVVDPLPYGRVVALEIADTFLGLAGGTMAVLAARVRFFQQQGLAATSAISSGVLISTASWITKGSLFLIAIPFGLSTIHFSKSPTGGTSRTVWLVVVVVAAVALALGLVLAVPRLRRLARDKLRPKLTDTIGHFKALAARPRKIVEIFAGAVAAQLCVALALGAALQAFGDHLSLATLLIVITLASMVGGASPVPGGVGVVEAGMILGLTAAGVGENEAAAAVFVQRLFTSYLPPLAGWFVMVHLRRKEYI